MKRSATKTHWLGSTASPDHAIALCLSKAECKDALRPIASDSVLKEHLRWKPVFSADTISVIDAYAQTYSVIWLRDGWQGRDSIQVAGLLVSAAVNAWRHRCNNRGFQTTEDEAHGIQLIARGLFTEFVRRTQSA